MNSFHEPTSGRAHWVFTHPRLNSLNRHLFRAGSTALSEQYEMTVSDLYADGFSPALGERDLQRGLLRRDRHWNEGDGEEHSECHQSTETEQVDLPLIADSTDELAQCCAGQVVPGGRCTDDVRLHVQ